MKIVKNYIDLRNQHASFFTNYNSKERIKHKEKIFDLKKQCDSTEITIVKSIINYAIDYERCFKELKENDMHHFLQDNVAISRFMIKQSISKSLGIDEMERHREIEAFEKLCYDVWDDFIITNEEREMLNNYCVEHHIDQTTQHQIEFKVREKINHSEIDLEKVVYYYAFQEYLTAEEIQNLIEHEYNKEISLKRIEQLIKVNDGKVQNIVLKEGESKIIREIKINEDITAQLIAVNTHLTSNLEFEIGFPDKTMDHDFNIIITNETYNKVDENRLIDIITDAACYNTYDNLAEFLYHKPLVRQLIEQYY